MTMDKNTHLNLTVRGSSGLSWRGNDNKEISIKWEVWRKGLKKKCDWHTEGGQILQTLQAAWERLLAPKEARRTAYQAKKSRNGSCFQQDKCHCCSHKICARILQHLFSKCHISARTGIARMYKNLTCTYFYFAWAHLVGATRSWCLKIWPQIASLEAECRQIFMHLNVFYFYGTIFAESGRSTMISSVVLCA